VTQPVGAVREQVDLRRALQTLKAAAMPIAVATLAAGAVAYAYSRAQPPVYEATTAIISAGNQTGNQTVNSILVSAPPLPPGALEEALVSAAVIGRVRDSVDAIPEATQAERARIRAALGREAASRRVRTLSLRGRLDPNGNGVYRLSARASRPSVAVALTNLAASAMIEWDVQRALERVRTAREALRAQLADTDARLARRGNAADQRSLADLRAEQVDQLNSITSLERAVSGTLRVVAPAVAPEEPILPRPARNAALAAALGLLGSAGLVLLRASLDRTVSTDADLKPFNLGAIGEIPRLRAGPKGASVLPQLQTGDAAEAIGFLRANLDALLPKGQPKIVLVTSGAPAEGKSSLTAALGHAFATAGQKTPHRRRRHPAAPPGRRLEPRDPRRRLGGPAGLRAPPRRRGPRPQGRPARAPRGPGAPARGGAQPPARGRRERRHGRALHRARLRGGPQGVGGGLRGRPHRLPAHPGSGRPGAHRAPHERRPRRARGRPHQPGGGAAHH
jgi:non-specific protein-tyrosine kinase